MQLADLERFEDSPAYDELEQAVLRFAEQWTVQGRVKPELMEFLGGRLTPSQLVTLAATVGLAMWTNRFSESFGMQLP